jgi:hypothetical protein
MVVRVDGRVGLDDDAQPVIGPHWLRREREQAEERQQCGSHVFPRGAVSKAGFALEFRLEPGGRLTA